MTVHSSALLARPATTYRAGLERRISSTVRTITYVSDPSPYYGVTRSALITAIRNAYPTAAMSRVGAPDFDWRLFSAVEDMVADLYSAQDATEWIGLVTTDGRADTWHLMIIDPAENV